MFKDKDKHRHGERNYHDKIFENEVNDLINITQSQYEACVNLILVNLSSSLTSVIIARITKVLLNTTSMSSNLLATGIVKSPWMPACMLI
jgi:hypothetical protein